MGESPKARASRERERGGLELRARARKLEPLSRGASWLGREPKARATRERGGLVRARAQWLSTSREWGLMLGREPGRDPARVGKGNTGIAGGGGLDAKCRVLTETAGGPSLACGRLVPWRPVVTGPPSVEAHKPTVRAPSSRGCGWFTSARSLSLYLADAGVSPELEALKRSFMRGESPELGPLKREGRACARAAREREALAKRSSARTQALKPSLARSLARSPVRRGRPVRER